MDDGVGQVFQSFTVQKVARSPFLRPLSILGKDQIPSDYGIFELMIDDSVVRILSTLEVPADWREIEPVRARTVGTEWIKSQSSAGLVVPSVVIPEERNLLLNPEHPDFQSGVRIVGPQPFEWDPRLFD